MTACAVSLLVYFLFVISTCSCPLNHFKVEEMEKCHHLLGCEDIQNMKLIKRLGTGAVKDVFLMMWNNSKVVLSIPVRVEVVGDFVNGVNNLKLLNPSKFVVQFLGSCSEPHALFTEFHPLGNAADFFKDIKLENEYIYLKFCYNYAQILNFLHNGPAGKRVFCDSNELTKLLSQLLITTDKRLILNDVDALPEVVNNSGVKCGHRQLVGTFVAPEQLWPNKGVFDDKLMPPYDEKSDIWKAASVCDFFLAQSYNTDPIRYKLFNIHATCKSRHPSMRPSAKELINAYEEVLHEYNRHYEL